MAASLVTGGPGRMEARAAGSRLHVLLVGNYPPDRQESMQRFAQAMFDGLRLSGVSVEWLRPESILGRFARNGQAGLGKWLGYLDKLVFFPRRLKRALRAAAAKGGRVVVHLCDHSNAFYVHHLGEIPHVVTCHDLLAVRSALGEIPANPTRWSGRRLQAMILQGLRETQHVACVSAATEADLLRIGGHPADRVSVIANSLNYDYSPMPEDEARAQVEALCRQWKLGEVGPGFVLHVGGNQWYKNRLGVLRIFARLVEGGDVRSKLVLVGESLSAEMETFLAERELADRVTRIPSCGNEELRALYSSAGLLLFPSLAEGFGWPVIEAQACGCPVVCSNAGPLPDVAGAGASLADPADEPALAEAARRLLEEPELRREMIAGGLENAARFQPARMIASYLECYSALTGAEATPETREPVSASRA